MSKLFNIFLLALLVVPSLCVMGGSKFNTHKIQLDKIKNNKGTWGSFLVTLAEVHLTTGGPLDQLIDAIEEVITDLENKLDRAHSDFDKRTAQHEDDVRRYNDLIDSANSDIASTTEYLAILELQRQNLVSDIASTEQSIEVNKRVTEEAIDARAAENAVYVAKIPEHNEAIAALDEALEVLSQLDGVDASFAQIKKINKSVETLNQKLKKGQDKAFLNALVELAANNKFADKSALLKVANLMKQVRQNLTSSLAQLADEEAAAVAAHELHLQQLADELHNLSTELTELGEHLTLTEELIDSNQDFLQTRIQDKANFEQDLADENASYEHDTEVYNDLVAQFNTELSACEAALDHLNNSHIEDFIGDRMQQDVVRDQPHGLGITVESDPNDLE